MHFLFGAGGTGGHLYPALAVAGELMKIVPECKITFAGRVDKIEGTKVPAFGYEFLPVDIEGLSFKPNPATLQNFVKLFKARNKVYNFIKQNKCSAVIVAGAYISIPPGFAAAKSKTPLFLMESNVNPGKAISLLTARSKAVFTSFEDSAKYFPQKWRKKIFFTGNPVRQDFLLPINKKDAKNKIGINPDKKTILIFGGSLGAKSINEFVAANLDNLSRINADIIWQTGGNFEFSDNIPDNIHQHNYIDDMSLYYSAADLIVCRSGASTVSELTLTGKPSVLVPLPSASNNEQLRNAEIMARIGASELVLNNELNSKLLSIVNELVADENKLLRMSESAGELAKPDAAKDVANKILEMIG
ncbi:MAG: undecaprenyldiphospho-muramoylpentapeptide beta-N-acetylglucosaminyltransferase [Candidatus Kapabacteria bacterium]|nr:undecaprenyldiphospho-muramoylpentapeptide beta-N-acetylglucosaminyltransferase [Ignavibacteriota bacterium]MCW5884961.1 undecaprenyldiphospho-muramoylpentapeptide beta-N-acetylglucosaminyltransferase [Candidatus Kapabacteria bacterium]